MVKRFPDILSIVEYLFRIKSALYLKAQHDST